MTLAAPHGHPLDEASRQHALDRYRILDSLPEAAYQDIVQVAATVCGTPIALVSLLDRERQWFKARLGLDAAQTSRNVAVCDFAIRHPDQLLEVPDLSQDPRFADFPAVTGDSGARFYAGMPLVTPEGAPIGTVCVVDHEPRELSPEQREALQALGRTTMRLLQARQRDHEQSVADLLEQAQAAHPPANDTVKATPYSVVILELQGLAGAVERRGERVIEKELQGLELVLQALLARDHGDSLDRVTGSAEFVAVLQGVDSQSRQQAMAHAIADFHQRSGLQVVMATALAESGHESATQVFLRADAALSAAKDALGLSAPG